MAISPLWQPSGGRGARLNNIEIYTIQRLLKQYLESYEGPKQINLQSINVVVNLARMGKMPNDQLR